MVRPGWLTIVTIVSGAMLSAACSYQPTFRFPIEQGSVEAGRQAFTDHECHRCHTVADVRLPPHAGASSLLLELGGETSQVKAYSELVTSIINPEHRISERYQEELRRRGLGSLESPVPMPMPHIDSMTVRQLIDLVAFLDSQYTLIEAYDSEL
jgi:hypothetical protein